MTLVPAVVLWTFLLCATTSSWAGVAAYTSPHCVNRADCIRCQRRSTTVHRLDDYGRPALLQVQEVRATTTRTVLFLVDERRLLVAPDSADGNTNINEAAQTTKVFQDPANVAAAGTTPTKAGSANIIQVGQPSLRPSILPESSSRLRMRWSSARSRLVNAIRSLPIKDIIMLLYQGWTIYATASWLWPIIQSDHIETLSLKSFLPPLMMTTTAKPWWDWALEVIYDTGVLVFAAHRTWVMVYQGITMFQDMDAWLRERQKQVEERQQNWEKQVWERQQDWEKQLLERELDWEKQLQERQQVWEMGLHDPQQGCHLRLEVRHQLWEKRLTNRQEDWEIRWQERYKDWENRLKERHLYWVRWSFLQLWEIKLEERQQYWNTLFQNRQQVWEKRVWKRQQDWEMEVQKKQQDWEKQDSEKRLQEPQQDWEKQKQLQERKQIWEPWQLKRMQERETCLHNRQQDWKTRLQNREQDWETRMQERQQDWETLLQNRQQNWESCMRKRRQNWWLFDWDCNYEEMKYWNGESFEDYMKRRSESFDDDMKRSDESFKDDMKRSNESFQDIMKRRY